MNFILDTLGLGALIAFGIFVGILIFFMRMVRKTSPGEVLVRTGIGGIRVFHSWGILIPVFHKMEKMDISLKKVEIERSGSDGLICNDNIRSDIKVAFYVRVSKTEVMQVAQSIGCARASHPEQLHLLFEAKFSEALKTVGKQFNFVQLYNERENFRDEIIRIIGSDLNGYALDNCHIDYLEQTPVEYLNEKNILDAQGIKKITELTAQEKIKSNLIEKEKEKIITKQNVEAREAILELNKQLAEAEEKQKREIANIKSRELAEIKKVGEEERRKSENARIEAEQDIKVAEENKDRQVIVALKNKERTEAVENERIEKDRMLEVTERERIVTLAQIEKEKVIETERRNIQDVIRERVMVEKLVVEEEEKIKDTKANSEAQRTKGVAITLAEKDAEEILVKQIKSAEASKKASEFKAQEMVIDAESTQLASVKQAEAIKNLAEAKAAESASLGMAEAQVMEAKAAATEKEGEANARVVELTGEAEAQANEKLGLVAAKLEIEKGLAEAQVIEKMAEAEFKRGGVEADVLKAKMIAEAEGIDQKAIAMKKLEGVGQAHEEFRLRLEKELKVDLAHLHTQESIAGSQAHVLSEALRNSNIEIIGGETIFFDKLVGAVTQGKSIDRMVNNSETVQDIKNTFFNSADGASFKDNLRKFIDQFGVTSEELKNLSITALITKMMSSANSEEKGMLGNFLNIATGMGIAEKSAAALGLDQFAGK